MFTRDTINLKEENKNRLHRLNSGFFSYHLETKALYFIKSLVFLDFWHLTSDFTFILIGERLNRRAANTLSMYDSLTGLPNFYLFEDRVQVIVNYENYKDVRQKRNMIAVACIALDNFEAFKSIGLHDLILRKLAEKLMLTLRKTYTVGSGLKYHFWILLPDVMDEESLKLELSKIQAIFREPVADNFTNHEISASIGVSVFPEPATSAKKLIEQAILSLQRAQKEGGNRMQIFGL